MQEKDQVQSFLDYLKYEKRYSRHTIISYQTDLRDCFDFLNEKFGALPLKEITSGIVRSWLASLKENGMSSRSVGRKIATLRSFFKYHLKIGNIELTPMVNVSTPKISKRLPVFIKEEEAERLLETASKTTENWKTLNANLLLMLFYNTGMRLSEVISLRDHQVDAARSQVKVLGKGNKERIIPLSGEVLAAISEYDRLKRREFGETDGFLLVTEKGKKLYPKYAYLLMNKYLGEAGTLEKKSPHVLRHTFATHLMEHGADLNAVKELLGHSSLAATQVYTHNTIEKLKNIHKKAHPKG